MGQEIYEIDDTKEIIQGQVSILTPGGTRTLNPNQGITPTEIASISGNYQDDFKPEDASSPTPVIVIT